MCEIPNISNLEWNKRHTWLSTSFLKNLFFLIVQPDISVNVNTQKSDIFLSLSLTQSVSVVFESNAMKETYY